MKKHIWDSLCLFIFILFFWVHGVPDAISASPVFYVDNKLTTTCNGNYSIAGRNCSGTDGTAYKTLQEAAAVAAAGTTVFIRSGTYVHNDTNREFLKLSVSGTSLAPIVFQNYGNEQVILKGRGFLDQDLNNDGYADGSSGSYTNEKLIDVESNYNQIKGLEVTNSNRWGVYVAGNFNNIENSIVHDNWDAGITLDGSSNTVKNVESHHNRHGSGLAFRPIALERIDHNIVSQSFFHDNGYQADGTKVLPAAGDPTGGGVSTGITGFNGCGTSVTYPDNLCNYNAIVGNVLLHNIGDGVNITMANTLIKDNIAMGSGTTGNAANGFTVNIPSFNQVYVNNISYHNNNAFNFRVHGGTYLNNLGLDNSITGMWLAFPSDTISLKNNLDMMAPSAKLLLIQPCSTTVCSNNLAVYSNPGSYLVNPSVFKDSSGNLVVTFPADRTTIAQQVDYIQTTVRAAFSPVSNSPAKSAGTQTTYIDPTTGLIASVYTGTSFDIGPVDQIPPAVSITAPATGVTVAGTNVTVSASVSDNIGVAGVQFKLDDNNLGAEDTAYPYSIVMDSTQFTSGVHKLTAVARDAAGNSTTSSSITVTIDNTPPTVSISAPTNNITVSGAGVMVSANASDNVGVVGVQFLMDSSNLGDEDTTSPYSVLFDTTKIANGLHILKAVARDTVGNTAVSSTVTVNVNNDWTPPAVSITAPGNNSIVSGTNVPVSASASDNVGVVGVQFKMDGNNLGSEVTAPPYSIIMDATQFSSGSHTLTAVARDAVGNSTTSSVITISISTSAVSYIYVDGQLTLASCVNYSVAARSCGAGTQKAYKDLNSVETILTPGTTVLIRGGTYVHNDANREFFKLAIPGTATAPIVVQNYANEQVVLVGRGFEDRDLNNDGLADGPTSSSTNEKLIDIEASYNQVKGLEVTNANRWGVYINGDYSYVENMNVHDNWEAGIYMASSHNTVKNVESYRNRHGSGILIRPDDKKRADYNVIADSYLHDNGYQPDGNVVLKAAGDTDGGGNSDGLTVYKGCQDNTVTPPVTYCQYNTISGNVGLHNSDDIYDFSFSDSLVKDNVAMDCCSIHSGTGPNGFKVFQYVNNDAYINNISYHNHEGFSLRVDGVTALNNIDIDNTTSGIWIAHPVLITKFKNNIDLLAPVNKLLQISGCLTPACSNNLKDDLTATPYLINPAVFKDSSGKIVVNFPASVTTIAQKVAFVQNTIRTAFTAKPGGPSAQTGVQESYIDPTTGLTQTITYMKNAPDIGILDDPKPPSVSITTPVNASTVSGTSVNVLTSSSNNAGVVGVQFKLDGNNLGSEVTSVPFSVIWNTTTVGNGTHSLTAVARDAAGNSTSTTAVSLTIKN